MITFVHLRTLCIVGEYAVVVISFAHLQSVFGEACGTIYDMLAFFPFTDSSPNSCSMWVIVKAMLMVVVVLAMLITLATAQLACKLCECCSVKSST